MSRVANVGTERDKAKAAYDATEGVNAGFRGSKRASAKAALDAAQAAVDELDTRRERYACRNATPGAATVATKSDPQTAIGTAEAMSGKSAATKAAEAAAIKATQDAAALHALHQDEAQTKAIQAFKPKPQGDPVKSIRYGDKTGKPAAPISATNVAPIPGSTIAQPRPGTQGAPVVPGAALAQAGGLSKVEVTNPVGLVTPVLITAQGVINVKDDAVAAAMSGLMGSLNSIAASCAAIAAKDFSPRITVQGGGGAGAAGATRERSSFSD
ncbi:hypothetical protein [Methylobacterium sp. NEAU K]|uniref:hypothetical protein n=1 Tax=Methylobacterium sp. NEAU K TaxID=3064946 RepID=UPI00273713C6|nr:hypothetical protein [Methylobacterium sp. NEAU K]MDP4006820.1 hypothetical protein [Methylobacterium sp. NEAU K]